MHLRLAAVIAAALIGPAAASASELRARLTIDVKIEGTESVVGSGADRTSGRFREGYTLVTYLKSDGDPMQFNPKDPQYGQKMMGMAAAVQQRAHEAQGKPAGRRMKPQELQEHLQKKQQACGTDTGCLMQLAMEAQQLSANLATGADGGASAVAYTGDEPPRYLMYLGYENCGASAHVYVDRTTEGSLADTVGPVAYKIQDTADYNSNSNDVRLICSLHQVVLDTQDGTIFTDGAFLPEAKGTSITTMRGETRRASGAAALHGEPNTWIAEQLRHAPRSGERRTTLRLTQNQGAALHAGRYSGEARVQLSWRLEDMK